MIPPIFASFIILCIFLKHCIKKSRKSQESAEKSFWEKENMANSTRKQSLDNLDYITIPLEILPTDILSDDETVSDCIQTVTELSTKSIVNLTGISNTDLKLEYGVANITALTEYDQNYTLLVRTLQKWANYIYQKGYAKEARTILEFAVSTHTDVSKTYSLLVTIYKEQNCPEKIHELMPIALSLNSGMQKTIVRILEQADPYND